jgi:hypothetical protein
MKYQILLLLFILSQSVSAQLIKIGDAEKDIKKFFESKNDYRYSGSRFTKDTVRFIEFKKRDKPDETACYYFNDEGICFSVLLSYSRKDIPLLLHAMDNNYLRTEDLKWINKSGNIKIEMDQDNKSTYVFLRARSVEVLYHKHFWTEEAKNIFRESALASEEIKILSEDLRLIFVNCILDKTVVDFPGGVNQSKMTSDCAQVLIYGSK